ncbi:hypothetical protein GF342_06060 [Candidatus Woesearchaeota archaeon]|nr:hypothetical protein [Candidatus Woesearchaeota archaeon]
MVSFETWWKKHFKGVPPIKFDLRKRLRDRWFRIHCLPQGKRYADSKKEYETIIERYNAVADAILGDKGDCWFVYAVDKDLLPKKIVLPDIKKQLTCDFEVLADPDDEESVMSFCTTSVKWKAGGFDALLREVADDEVGPLYFVNKKTRRIFAPYDGGADLFCKTKTERDKFAKQFKSWLPKKKQTGY